MMKLARLLVLCGLVAVIGCSPTGSSPLDGQGDPGDGGTIDAAAVISGTLTASPSAPWGSPPAPSEDNVYMVVGVSDATGQAYTCMTSATGDFEVIVPEDELGNSFMVSILGPDGKPLGPVVFEASDTEANTGVKVRDRLGIGTIPIPDDCTSEPIKPAGDGDALGGLVDASIKARLNAHGAPTGTGNYGKGAGAKLGSASPGSGLCDRDRDGLIDLLDADDDGDGTIDDFDPDSGTTTGSGGMSPVNIFMNLKITSDKANTYYAGTTTDIETALKTDTVVTFDVQVDMTAVPTPTSARALDKPAPSYITVCQRWGGSGTPPLWKDVSYALLDKSDKTGFEAFITPNDLLAAGDTFIIEIMYKDGSVKRYSRMLNYVFKNIPKLVNYGDGTTMTSFDVTSSTANGGTDHPIRFNGTKDLVLEYNPPLDDTGAYITGMDYSFQIFYENSSGQLNNDIDWATTFATPISGFDRGRYVVSAGSLTLSGTNTYTVTLPKEMFTSTVTLNDGSTTSATQFKIDITAEHTSGNAAIMLVFKKSP